jgi:hypothetical protein
MKQLMLLLLMISFLIFIACKESDEEGFSIIRVDDKKDGGIHEIILYEDDDSGNYWTGNLGGRSGMDQKCRDSINRPSDKPNAIGFISINAVDKIADLPKNNYFPGEVPIKSLTGQIVANNWGELMSNNLGGSNTLQTLNVSTSAIGWWSGGRFGSNSNETCNGFTASSIFTGLLGSIASTNNWIETSPSSDCASSTIVILCIAY